MNNDSLQILKTFSRKLVNSRFRVAPKKLIDQLKGGEFGYTIEESSPTVAENDFVLVDDFAALIDHIKEILGENSFNGVVIENVKSKATSKILADGIFVSIGRSPATELVKNRLNLDASGYIVAGEDTKTNIDGVYAIGDVRTKPLRQVVTAVGDGANAIYYAEEYLSKFKE